MRCSRGWSQPGCSSQQTLLWAQAVPAAGEIPLGAATARSSRCPPRPLPAAPRRCSRSGNRTGTAGQRDQTPWNQGYCKERETRDLGVLFAFNTKHFRVQKRLNWKQILNDILIPEFWRARRKTQQKFATGLLKSILQKKSRPNHQRNKPAPVKSAPPEMQGSSWQTLIKATNN